MAVLDLLGLDTIWLAVPLALGAGALAVWLYLPDARTLRRAQAVTLLALRAAAVLALAIILLQPVLRFTRTGRKKATLVFFVDTSQSMSVADTGVSPERVKQIIEGLRLRDKAKDERAPEDLAARADDLLKAVEGLAAPGEPIADWRAGLESVRGPAGAISEALMELDTDRIPVSDRAAVETAAFVRDEFVRFGAEEGDAEEKTAGRLKWLAQDVKGAAEKLKAQIGWLDKALGKRAREDVVSSEESARRLATESTRFDLALLALTSEKLGIIEKLAKTHELRGFRLSGTIEHFDLLRDGKPVGPEEIELAPTGKATDLAGGVLAGVNELAGGPSRVAGVVVLSDGRQTTRGSPFDTAAELGARGIPVYAIGVGSTERPRDAAIAKLSAPESVFKDDVIELAATVTMSGIVPPFGEDQLPVTLSEGGRTLEIKNANVEHGTGSVTFEVRAEEPGIRRFTLAIPEFERESTLGNNSREVAVKVVDDKLRVTIVFEYPRWELRFVRNLIWRNRKIELDVVSFIDEPIGKSNDEPGRRHLGRTRREIMKSSVLVLDDVAAGRLSAEDRKNVAEFVSRRGGTIIMIAGPEHLPSEYTEPPLAELLPFKRGARPAWRVRGAVPGSPLPGQATEPFTLALTPEGAAEAFMSVAGEEDPQDFWPSLPGFFEYVGGCDVAEGAKVLLKVRETGDPILTVHRYGLGKVIFLAMHETWRWRYKVADRDHGRFWGNVLRYAGEEPFAVKDRFVSLDADRVVYPPGEPVNVRARVVDAEGLPVTVREGANDLVCVLERKVALDEAAEEDAGDDEAIRLVLRRPLEASLEGGGVYRAVFGSVSSGGDRLPSGDYTIRVESPRLESLYGTLQKDEPTGVTLEISVRPARGGEFKDTSFSEETLAEMARKSFGRYFDISQIGELPEAVGRGWQERTTVTRIELWSSYYVYALVLALLSAEWIYRKRLGLA